MNLKNRKPKIIEAADGFNIVITIVALIFAIAGTAIICNPDKDLNEAGAILYITIATLISSIISPVLILCRVNRDKEKHISIAIGSVLSAIIFLYSFICGNDFFNFLTSLSKRGGFTVISVTLLLLQLTYINYEYNNKELEKERENAKEAHEKMVVEIKKNIKANEKIIELNKKLQGKGE